jgi:hypothetical protein
MLIGVEGVVVEDLRVDVSREVLGDPSATPG